MLSLLLNKNKYIFPQLCGEVCSSAGILLGLKISKTKVIPDLCCGWMTWSQSHAPTVIMQRRFKAAASTFAFGHKRQLSDSCQVVAALFWLIGLHTHTSTLCVCVHVCVCVWVPRSAAVTDLSHGLTSRFDLQYVLCCSLKATGSNLDFVFHWLI